MCKFIISLKSIENSKAYFKKRIANCYLYYDKKLSPKKYEDTDYVIYLLNDYILSTPAANLKASPKWIIENIKGNFYYIIIYKKAVKIIIGSSFLSLLPIYYNKQKLPFHKSL